jgi:hypothetical protein
MTVMATETRRRRGRARPGARGPCLVTVNGTVPLKPEGPVVGGSISRNVDPKDKDCISDPGLQSCGRTHPGPGPGIRRPGRAAACKVPFHIVPFTYLNSKSSQKKSQQTFNVGTANLTNLQAWRPRATVRVPLDQKLDRPDVPCKLW